MEGGAREQSHDPEETDALDALGSLANFAGAEQQAEQQGRSAQLHDGNGSGSEAEGREEEEDDEGMLPPSKPFTRTMQKQEKEALQKWVQCARCNQWRKVPYDVVDDDIPDAWTCPDNVWDRSHNSCNIPQALSDEQIDEILMQQGEMDHDAADAAAAALHVNIGYAAKDDDADYEHPAAYGVVPVRGGSRARAAARNSPSAAAAAAAAAGNTAFGGPGVSALGRTANGGRGVPGFGLGGSGIVRPGSAGRGARAPARGAARGGNGGGRGRGRIGRGLSEAAAALLDMGFAEDEADAEGQAAYDGYAPPAGAAASPFPPGAFRPRQVVWAKVEGHDWWPARVVRRRAVPREVGPPPGAPAFVRHHIPVVFFTRKGIPGEVDEGMDTANGALSACLRALKASGHPEEKDKDASSGDDEAEFAWLPVNALRPFAEGKQEGIGSTSTDPTLKECIAAAEQAEMAQAKNMAARQGSAGSSGAAPAIAEEDTDSDGGWGLPPPSEQVPTPRRGGRGRGRRGGRGRSGRGMKGRGRGWRRGGGRGDDFDSDTESVDLEGHTGADGQRVVVDTILGWRLPLTDAEKAEEQEAAKRYATESRKRLQAMRGAEAAAAAVAGGGVSPAVPDATQVAAAMPPPPAVPSSAPKPAQPKAEEADSPGSAAADEPAAADAEPMHQDEADAVAALLAAASGDIDSVEGIGQGPGRQAEYLVKWLGKAHVHNEWVSRDLLLRIAKRKLMNFERRCGTAPCNEMDPAWKVPERFVARRPSPTGPGWEVLVKWSRLACDQCTWEVEGEGVLVMPQYLGLHKALWERQQSALRRSQPEALAVAEAAKQAAAASTPEITEQPEWVRGGKLYPHQLEAVNWLRRQWAADTPVLLADDVGLGKTATVIAFLQFLRHEMEAVRPILVVAPSSMLPFWEGEVALWIGSDANVVIYSGVLAARTVMHDNELWLAPGSMDGKSASFKTREALPARVPKPDIVITSYEAAAADAPALKAISWEVILLDERQRGRAGLAKVHSALGDLDAAFRMLIAGSRVQASSNDAAAMEFLQPPHLNLEALAQNKPKGSPEAAAQAEKLRAALGTLTLRRLRADVGPAAPVLLEVALPVELTAPQAACYRTVLTRFYELLSDPKPPRHSGHRASQLRGVVAELRKVCAYPTLLSEFTMLPSAGGKDVAMAEEDSSPRVSPEVEAAPVAAVAAADEDGKPEDLVAASGKMRLLRQLLPALQAGGHRVLLLSQSRKALDTIEQFVKDAFSAAAYERIDGGTYAAQRHAAVQRFNQPDSPAWLFLLAVRSCGLGTDLPGVSAVVVHDSDWDPRLDLQAMSHARRIGSGGKLPVYRLFMRHTVEERLLALSSERRRNIAALIRPAAGRSSPEGARLLEDIVRWGTDVLFSPEALADSRPTADAAPQQQPTAAVKAEAAANGDPATGPVAMQEDGRGGNKQPAAAAADAASVPAPLSDAALQQLVGIADEICKSSAWRPAAFSAAADAAQAPNSATNGPVSRATVASNTGEAARLVTGLGPDLEAVSAREWRANECEAEESSESVEEEDEEGEDGAEDGNGVLARTDSLASSSSFWESLLRPHYLRLKREEEDALAQTLVEQQEQDGEGDVSGGRGGALLGDDSDADADMQDEDDRPPSRAGSGMTASTSGDADYVVGGRARGGRGRYARAAATAAGRGRLQRRRRGEEDDLAAAADEGRGKRRRRVVATNEGRTAATSGEIETLRREWGRHEAVMRNIADPASAEGGIARRAFDRLTDIAAELQLDSNIVELAHQAAEILLMMRPDTEVPSDFQDYTLVALVGVAVHLSGASPSEPAVLPTLARRYQQDVAALEQVFEYIMQSLANYRTMYQRMQALVKDGTLEQTANGISALGRDFSGSAGLVSDMDAFSRKLNDIVQADYTHAALAAGPLEVPSGPLQQLYNFLPQDAGALASETEQILSQLRGMQEQVALFDRIHSIRVKAIQEEYQRYMERVRTKAQNAIDQANTSYQHSRSMLTARVDTLVHYLQNRHLHQLQQQQQQQAAQQQQQQQQQGAAQQAQQQPGGPHGQEAGNSVVDAYGHVQTQSEPGLADLAAQPAFMRYLQNVQANGMNAEQLEQLKHHFLEQQRREQLAAQQAAAIKQQQAQAAAAQQQAGTQQQAAAPSQPMAAQQLQPQQQPHQQQQATPGGEPAERPQEGEDGDAATNGRRGGQPAKPPRAPQLPHVASAPQLSKAQGGAAAQPQTSAAGYAASAASSAGFLSQQQHLLARQLAQPTGLPLTRLTPLQSQQVLGMWQAQQPEQPQQTTVIQRARSDAAQPLPSASAAPAVGAAVSTGFSAFSQQREAAVSPAPQAAGLTKTASGSLVRGVTVQSGAPGLPGHPVKGGGGRDGSPFEGGDLDLKRQLSARSLSGQLEMARTHSGPLPIVTSGGRGSQGGANDIGLGLGSRPSISTGLPPQPRGASRLATPLKPKSRDASPTTPSPASSPGGPPQAAPGQHLHVTTGGGGGAIGGTGAAAARQHSGLVPADSGIRPSAFASAAAQQQQRASASPGAGRSGAAVAAQEPRQQPAAAEQQPVGASQPPLRHQPQAQQQLVQPQQQPLPPLQSPQQPASPSARPSSGAAGASPARREGSLRAWIPASAADAAAGTGLQAALAGDGAAATAAAAMQQKAAAGVAVPQQQQQQQ